MPSSDLPGRKRHRLRGYRLDPKKGGNDIGRNNKGYQFPDPASLFRRRLKSHIRDRVNVVRSIVDDWTVLLYILIPGLLLGGRLYYGLWRHPLPEWAASLPFALMPALLLIVASMGSILLLVHEADVLFMIQRRSWMQGVMIRSSLYSMAAAALKTSIGYLILLPFLVRQFHQDVPSVFGLLMFTITFEWVLMWSKHLIAVQTRGWKRWLLFVPFAFVASALYGAFAVWFRQEPVILALGAIVLAAVTLILLIARLRLRGTFMIDVQEDLKNRTELTSLALSQAVDKPRRIRKKTWVFRRSGSVFRSTEPSKRIAGAMIKTLLRYPKQLMLYAQYAGISAVVLLTVPSGVNMVAFAALHMLLVFWLFLQWFSFRQDAFVSLLPWSYEQNAKSSLIAVRALLLPFAVLASAALLFGAGVSVWIAVIGIIPLSAVTAWVIPYAMRRFMLSKG
ncbi:ABC transporter permease [Paenibacillus sp. SAF-054]|uniref:ABC transporter permease n=1 Tax=unclassified Paenibacillus TaxID=185978 RepID=UPI003F7D044E